MPHIEPTNWSARLRHPDIQIGHSVVRRHCQNTTNLVGALLNACPSNWKIRIVKGTSTVSLFQRRCSIYLGLCSLGSAAHTTFVYY